jgi:hypothetical protein
MKTSSTWLSNLLLVCIVGLIVVHSVSLMKRQRLLLLDPLYAFWAGVLIIYVGQPLSHGQTLIGWHSPGVFEASLFWSCVAFVFVVFGYEWRLGQRGGLKLPAVPSRLSPLKLSLAGYAMIVLGVLGYLYLFASAGGVTQWLSVGRGATDYENISAYVAQLVDLLPVGIGLLLFQMHFHPSSTPKKILVWILATLMWSWFFYLGSRSRMIGFTILGLGAYFLPRRKSPPLALVGTVFVLLFVLSKFQGSYRENFTNLSLNLDQIEMAEAEQKVLPIFLGGDQAVQNEEASSGIEFNCVMSVIELVPSEVPFNYGYGHLEVFTRWIPRAIWPGKRYPHMESVQGVLREADLSQATVRDSDLLMGPAFTFVGHWYYVAGPFGLILGGLLAGVLFRLIRTLYDRDSGSEGGLLVYVSLISVGFSEAAATPLSWILTLPFVVGPLALILFLCRLKPANSHRNQSKVAISPSLANANGKPS